MFAALQQSRFSQSGFYKHCLKLRDYFPAIAFFGGFIWDAVTLGKNVQQSDLIILSAYLFGAALILAWLAHLSHQMLPESSHENWRERAPYFLLQFLFGSLLSALFIVYFKSASHWLALFWSLGLAALLVGNEFLEEHYTWLPLSWSMFGLCAILLLNFVLPCLLGSVHWVWFYVSTLLGVLLTHWLYARTHDNAGTVIPVWVVAVLLMVAYSLDWIPPVPLVKQEVVFGTNLQKTVNAYQLQIDKNPWWQFWPGHSHAIHLAAGEPVYCVSSVFAPSGLQTKLYHRWEYHDPKRGWVTTSRMGFLLSGGRQAGFRGYTYKQNWQAGDWRVSIETEDGRTLSADGFEIIAIANGKSQERAPATI